MAQRGRKSSVALASAPLTVAVREQRIMPPAHLSDAEREVWLQFVNDQAAGAFLETHIPLMEMYCRHVVQSRILADEILNFDRAWLADTEGLDRYDKLLKMHERENRAASSCATRLRITRQSLHHETADNVFKNSARTRKPWELNAE